MPSSPEPFELFALRYARLQGHKTARALADSPDHVIPGHDPLVMEFYPPPTPELQGKVVRLDIAPTQRG